MTKPKQTHTIRGAGVQPIATFRPWMLDLLCNARIESSLLVIAKFKKDYKQITGRDLLIDYDQQQRIMQCINRDQNGYWVSQYSKLDYGLFSITNYFTRGYMQGTIKDMEVELDEVELFYDMIDQQIENKLLV
jgi:hypothetical protein